MKFDIPFMVQEVTICSLYHGTYCAEFGSLKYSGRAFWRGTVLLLSGTVYELGIYVNGDKGKLPGKVTKTDVTEFFNLSCWQRKPSCSAEEVSTHVVNLLRIKFLILFCTENCFHL